MFFNPALAKSSVIRPGCEQRNMPGAPGAGGVSCSIVIIVCMDVETHAFFSGIFHTDATMRHPGFKTRIISLMARFIIGNKLKPNRHVIALKLPFPKGSAEISQQLVS